MARRRYRTKWFRFTIIIIMGYFFYTCVTQQMELSKIQREAVAVYANIDQLKEENTKLMEERDNLNTPAYVEKIAREELGLVKPGEIPYIPTKKK